MAKLPKTWLTALGAAGLLTIVFALLALVLYTRTERSVVEKHSQDQQLLAELAATALAQRVDNHLHRLEGEAALLRARPRQWQEAPTALSPAGGTLFLLHPDGQLHFREAPRSRAALEAAVLPWLGALEPVLTNPFPPGGGDSEVVLLVPVLEDGRVVLQVGLTLSFAALVETLLARRNQPVHLNLALLDEQGQVLANTRHPEMVGRRVPPPNGNCLPCHTGFDLERRMVAGQTGVDSLQVGGEPLALVAFSPVEVAGRRWSLALTEPYTAITADTRQGFRGITLLLGVSLLVGIAATTLTFQYRAQRRRAEERAHLAERRAALERQLRQSEQLASIGRMTSHIAHQINTPLAALGLNVTYLRLEVARRLGGASAEIEEVSEAIAGEIDRLKRVVNDYLRFARLPQPAPELHSLRELVEGFLDFIEPEARGRGVRLDADLGAEPAVARVDADLFRQAFLNLVQNSFEAMPQGGTLRLRLRSENGELVLALEDTGRGISDQALPRIFDPFFTTKKDGTGLGLAHVRRVVEEHGGSIECWSRSGEGTRFVLRLPAATGDLAEKELQTSEKGR